MSQVFTGEETVIKNVALLLQTGRFSDLTLVCKDRRFRVHRAIVCSRSPVWAAAAEGGFKEMETKIVEVDIVDPDTLHRALTYLYTGTYGDADVPTSNAVALDSEHNSILEASGLDVLTATNDNAQNHSDESDLDSADAAIPSAHSQAQPTLPDTEVTVQEESPVVADGGDDFKSNDNCDHAIEERKSGRSSANLRVHTLVYILADYYQVPDLRRLAVNKFAAALDMEDEEGLGDICHLVYRVAPSTHATYARVFPTPLPLMVEH
ncbi:hypothetical protein LTS02_017858 [Friedmanniomyces endolithicus]|nr:hypothetical protein LTS02_017858 [Friedmanniomyces endolithicus]